MPGILAGKDASGPVHDGLPERREIVIALLTELDAMAVSEAMKTLEQKALVSPGPDPSCRVASGGRNALGRLAAAG